jgi:hypothetical protein
MPYIGRAMDEEGYEIQDKSHFEKAFKAYVVVLIAFSRTSCERCRIREYIPDI